MIGRHVAKYGEYEPVLTSWIAKHLANSPSGIFIDVGANIGWHTLHARQQSSVETVVAFEPEPCNAWILDRNLTLHGADNVIVSACAVGARPGVGTLYRYKPSHRGRHSMIANFGYGLRRVPVLDLDSVIDHLGLGDRRVLAVKIDVEGYEPAVIAGASSTLARADAVIIEYNPARSSAGGLSVEGMLRRLHNGGFTPHELLEDGDLAELTLDRLRSFDGEMNVVWTKSSGDGAAPPRMPAPSS
jgi:FkbM family methyltransferase